MSIGGIRALSDDAFGIGDRLDLELLIEDGTWVVCWVRVVWVDELVQNAAARYEVGMQFVDLAEEDQQRLASVLHRQP